MTVAEMIKDLSETIARGKSLDHVIATRLGWAIRFIERNHSLRYMRMVGQCDLPAGAVRIELPRIGIKSIRWVRVVSSTGAYGYIPRVGDDRLGHGDRHPLHGYTYQHVQPRYIRLSMPFINNAVVEVAWNQYTPLVLPHQAEPTLLDMAPDLISGQTMLYLSSRIRDAQLIRLYKEMRDEGLKTLVVAEDEAEWTDRKLVMGPVEYSDQIDEAVEYPLVPLGSELFQPTAEQVEASTDAWAPFGLYVFGGGDVSDADEVMEVT